MSRGSIRATVVALGCATALAVTAGSAGARLSAPGTAANSNCTSQAAGYGPLAGTTGQWVWYGDLRLVTCITRGTGGWFWASSRLNGPYDPSNGNHSRFTGGWTIRLQGCVPRSATTLETAVENWDGADHAVYDQGAVSGGRYYFSTVYTPNHAPGYSSYRVWAHSTAADVVPASISGWTYALSPNGLNGAADFYSPCMGA
jgi:hypothetical protein